MTDNFLICQSLLYLSSTAWMSAFEHILRWRTPIFSLACSDIQGVSCALQQGLKHTHTHTKQTLTELRLQRRVYMTFNLTR